MKKHFLIAVFLLSSIMISRAGDSIMTKDPDRKFIPVVQIFANNYYCFWIDRAFLGFQYNFNEKWSTKILIDRGFPTTVGQITVTDSSGNVHYVTNSAHEGAFYTMYLKLATLRWQINDQIALEGGVILQNHYITQDRFWQLRYVAQTFVDRYYGIPPTDLGFIGYYKINNVFSIDAAVTNGEGPRFSQDAYGKVKIGTGIDIKPAKYIQLRFYYHNKTSGAQNSSTEQLISVFAGIHISPKSRLGLEYNRIRNLFNSSGTNSSGYSFYGACGLGKKTELFARLDRLLYNGNLEPEPVLGNGISFIGGISHNPVRGISISLNYQRYLPDHADNFTMNQVRLSMEIKPEL